MTPEALERSAWEGAGLISETGDLLSPLSPALISASYEVELEGDCLVWRWFEEPALPDWWNPGRLVPREALFEFVRLAESDGEDIATFARRWGVLGICEHNLPASHNPPEERGFRVGRPCRPQLKAGSTDVYSEPLSAWRAFADEARAVRDLAKELHVERLGAASDWRKAFARQKGVESLSSEMDVTGQRWLLMWKVKEWLVLGNVRPQPVWYDRGPAVELGGPSLDVPGLFGALAAHLMSIVCSSHGIEVCTNCGCAYQPRRRRSRFLRNYCPKKTCQRAKYRDAKRDQRRRACGPA